MDSQDYLDDHWGWFIDIELTNINEPLPLPKKIPACLLETIDEEYEYYMTNVNDVESESHLVCSTHIKISWVTALFTYLLYFIKWM